MALAFYSSRRGYDGPSLSRRSLAKAAAAKFSGSPRRSYRSRRNPRAFRILNPYSVELRGVLNSPDPETVLRAIEDDTRIHGEYIQSGQREATRTVERLLAVLDNDVAHAPDRMNRRKVLRLVD
jgi:hypothetical protein